MSKENFAIRFGALKDDFVSEFPPKVQSVGVSLTTFLPQPLGKFALSFSQLDQIITFLLSLSANFIILTHQTFWSSCQMAVNSLQ